MNLVLMKAATSTALRSLFNWPWKR